MLIFSPCGCHKIFSYSYFTDISGLFVVYSGASGKESACQFRRLKRRRFNAWVGMILWRRKWQPTPVFLPAVSYGQRSLVGYSPQGHKELDMTERLSMPHAQIQYVANDGLFPMAQPYFSSNFLCL